MVEWDFEFNPWYPNDEPPRTPGPNPTRAFPFEPWNPWGPRVKDVGDFPFDPSRWVADTGAGGGDIPPEQQGQEELPFPVMSPGFIAFDSSFPSLSVIFPKILFASFYQQIPI